MFSLNVMIERNVEKDLMWIEVGTLFGMVVWSCLYFKFLCSELNIVLALVMSVLIVAGFDI